VARWAACAGATGRWRNNLIAKCVAAGAAHDDPAVSPVVRQTLQHWAYRLTQADHDAYAAKVRRGKSTSFIGVIAAPARKAGKRGAGAGAGEGEGEGARKAGKKRVASSDKDDEGRGTGKRTRGGS
jgi:hypothetical protein